MSNTSCSIVVSLSLMIFLSCLSTTTAFLFVNESSKGFIELLPFLINGTKYPNELLKKYSADHKLVKLTLSDAPVLHTNPPDFTKAAGFCFDAVCSSHHPIEWRRRADPFTSRLEKSFNVTLGSEDDLELHIDAVTYKDVGFYDCRRTDNLRKNSTESFYLFVDDPANLRVGPPVIRIKHTTYEPAVIPCVPTAPDVDVRLLTSFREIIPFSIDPKDEKVYIYYDARRGFMVPDVHLEGFWHTYICEFTKRGVEQEMIVDLFVNTGTKNKIAFLEHQADTKNEITAVLGSTVEFVAEVYANYEPVVSWHNSTGDVVVTGSKYRVERTSGEPYETRLIVSNVDKGDSGRYFARLNVPREPLPYQQLNFFLHAEDTYKLDIVMNKVFLISDEVFIADCTVSPPKKRLRSMWTIRPHVCEGSSKCVMAVTSVDKMKPGEIGYVMHSSHSVALHKPILGNLTCVAIFDDNTTASVTRALIVSEVKDGFQVEFKSFNHSVVLNCNVSRFLYSDNLYWIDSSGKVITQNNTDPIQNLTLTKSETMYSYRLSLKIVLHLGFDLIREEYRCMAVDYHHVPTFKPLKIQIVNGYAPAIISSNMNNRTKFAECGSYLNFTCHSSGYPDPTLYWYKDGKKTGEDGQNDLIFIASMNDSGRYSCQVHNNFGSDFTYIDLEIYQPTSIDDKKNGLNLETMLWPRFALLCSDGGQPARKVTWFKDDKSVLESSRITTKNNGTILSINPFKRSDLGFYSCRSGYYSADTGSRSAVTCAVLGSIICIVIVSIVIYFGVKRFKYLRPCKTSLTYRSLLHRE